MSRSVLLLMLVPLSACAPAAGTPPEKQFVLADPNKYKSEAEKQRATELVKTACKTKALAASAELEKTIASERKSMENLERAREKAAEMYETSYDLCMLSSGYIKK